MNEHPQDVPGKLTLTMGTTTVIATIDGNGWRCDPVDYKELFDAAAPVSSKPAGPFWDSAFRDAVKYWKRAGAKVDVDQEPGLAPFDPDGIY